MGVQLEKQILILSNLHKYKMGSTEIETPIIILLTFASNLPFEDTLV